MPLRAVHYGFYALHFSPSSTSWMTCSSYGTDLSPCCESHGFVSITAGTPSSRAQSRIEPALAFFPAASEIRRHAEHLIDETLAGMDDGADFAESSKQRAALAARLGADQPLQARFQSAVIVAAPLATSLFSSLIGS